MICFFLGSSLEVLIVIIACLLALTSTSHSFKSFTYLHVINTCKALIDFMFKTMLKEKVENLVMRKYVS